MIKKFKNKLKHLDQHTLEVVKKSSSSLIVKVAGMIAGLFVSIFIGRTLGVDGLGIINLANQIISFLLIIGILGFSQVIIKEIAIANSKGNTHRVKDILFTAYLINGAAGVLCTVTLILFSETLANSFFHTPGLRVPLVILSIVFTPQIVSRILSSALIGYKKIWQSNLVDQTLSMVIVGILLFALWVFNFEIDVIKVAIVYAIGRLCVTLTVTFYWKHLNRKPQKYKPVFLGSYMMNKGFPLLIVSASLLISTSADTIMLGWLSSTKEVGLYTVAAKLALLTSFFLQITVSTVGPKIAVMYRNQEIKALELMLQKVTRALIGIGLLSLIVFLLLGKYILNFWGEEFVSAYPILAILATGQFFNIASGPVGTILVMTNHEKIIRNITAITVGLNLILNYFFINYLGASGAAIATAFTTILNMVLCVFFVRKATGLNIFKLF
jgi:O-antigen/teichoic acid export membrane protein